MEAVEICHSPQSIPLLINLGNGDPSVNLNANPKLETLECFELKSPIKISATFPRCMKATPNHSEHLQHSIQTNPNTLPTQEITAKAPPYLNSKPKTTLEGWSQTHGAPPERSRPMGKRASMTMDKMDEKLEEEERGRIRSQSEPPGRVIELPARKIISINPTVNNAKSVIVAETKSRDAPGDADQPSTHVNQEPASRKTNISKHNHHGFSSPTPCSSPPITDGDQSMLKYSTISIFREPLSVSKSKAHWSYSGRSRSNRKRTDIRSIDFSQSTSPLSVNHEDVCWSFNGSTQIYLRKNNHNASSRSIKLERNSNIQEPDQLSPNEKINYHIPTATSGRVSVTSPNPNGHKKQTCVVFNLTRNECFEFHELDAPKSRCKPIQGYISSTGQAPGEGKSSQRSSIYRHSKLSVERDHIGRSVSMEVITPSTKRIPNYKSIEINRGKIPWTKFQNGVTEIDLDCTEKACRNMMRARRPLSAQYHHPGTRKVDQNYNQFRQVVRPNNIHAKNIEIHN